MGDRCYLEITGRSTDWAEHFYEDFGPPENDNDDGIVATARIDEANYGLVSEREALAKKKIPFMGYHGNGDDYGACLFCSPGDGEHFEASCDDDGIPNIRVKIIDGKCVPNEDDLLGTQNFIDALRKTEQVLATDFDNGWWRAVKNK